MTIALTLQGAIEQAVASHPDIAECAVVGIPDSLKGNLSFAFVTLSTQHHPLSAVPDEVFFREAQRNVHEQIGPIASLGGMIGQGHPKDQERENTSSGPEGID